jgi:hypothetical protein
MPTRALAASLHNEPKKIRGELYIIPNNINELLPRLHRNFETKPGD